MAECAKTMTADQDLEHEERKWVNMRRVKEAKSKPSLPAGHVNAIKTLPLCHAHYPLPAIHYPVPPLQPRPQINAVD